MSSLMGPRAPVAEVPEARHHVMLELDQPLGFIAALRMLLNSWMRNESAQQGDQGFESFSLDQRVRCEPDSSIGAPNI
jgi:hypothetical protein